MELTPSQDAKLACPKCGGAVKTIHPYYTVMDKWFMVGLKHQFTWYILAGILLAVWWPLGIAAFFLAWLKGVNEAKSAVLYRCEKCSSELSFAEAEAAAKE